MSAVYNVRAFGAKGDGVTPDTEAIQKTIDACAGAGGGVVTLPPGTYLCSTLYLRCNLTFELGQGAVLLGSKSLSDYGASSDDREFYRDEAARANSHAARLLAAGCVGFFIRGIGLRDVTICGPGVIDGNEEAREDGRRGARTIFFEDCRNVTLRDITVVRSPSENTGFLECEDVRILGMKIRDSFADGIYIISCRRVLIDGCVIETSGDDPLSLKNEGRPERPSFQKDVVEDVLITNTTVRNAEHPGFKIGTDTAGVFRNILVSNCIFENVQSMFAIQLMRPKLKENKERIIENVMFSNVIVRDAWSAIDITTMGVDEAVVSDLVFDNLLVSGMREPSRIHGSEHVSISNVTIKSSRFVHSRSSMTKWLSCLDTKNVRVRDVTFDLREPLERVVEVDRADGFTWDGVSMRGEAVRDCVVKVGNASDVEIRGCTAKGVRAFLQVGEGGLSDVRFLGNDFQDATEASFAGWDAISGEVRPVADRISSSVVEMEREVDPGTALTIKVRLRNEGERGWVSAEGDRGWQDPGWAVGVSWTGGVQDGCVRDGTDLSVRKARDAGGRRAGDRNRSRGALHAHVSRTIGAASGGGQAWGFVGEGSGSERRWDARRGGGGAGCRRAQVEGGGLAGAGRMFVCDLRRFQRRGVFPSAQGRRLSSLGVLHVCKHGRAVFCTITTVASRFTRAGSVERSSSTRLSIFRG